MKAVSKKSLQSGGALLALGISFLVPVSLHAAVTNDLSVDFSSTSNPNGVWSYGYAGTVGGPFNLLLSRQSSVCENGVPISSWQLTPTTSPIVAQNGTAQTGSISGGQALLPPGTVYFWPGQDGRPENFGVVRFTVPTNGAGDYQVEAAVQCFYAGSYSGDADFHIATNGVEAFGAAIPPRTGAAAATNVFALVAGDTIDFMIGRGQDGSEYGSGLKIQARVTGLNVEPPPPPPPPGPCVAAPDGLAAWWGFDGNADEMGGSDGPAFSGTFRYAAGEVGQALTLDGHSGFAQASAVPVLNVGAGSGLTIEAWINPTDAARMANLIEWNDRGGGIGAHFSIAVPNSYGGGPGSLFANLVDTSGISHQVTTVPGVLASGVFQHVAVTYEKASGLAVLYLNGVQVALTNLGTFTPQTGFDLFVGIRPSGPFSGIRFAGLIDELSIYGRALSLAEIQAVFNATNGGKCKTARPPVILAQPQSQVGYEGRSVLFSVTAGGSGPFGYQWVFNGVPLPDATNTTLLLPSVQPAQAGAYSVVVTNIAGSVTSDTATLTVSAVPACVPSPGGIVAWWGLDGNSDDLVGANVLGLSGSPRYGEGQVGQALELEGSYVFGQALAALALNVGSGSGFTIEAWVNPREAGRMANLVEWNDRYGNIGAHLALSVPNSYGGGPGCLFANLVDTAGVSHQVTSRPGLLASGVFQHVAATYEKSGGWAALYLNGVQVALTNLGSFTPQTSYDLFVGVRPSGPFSGSWFTGLIDELSLYGRALSPAEVLAVFNANVGGKCKAARAPEILTQPQRKVAYEGQTASFQVIAGGTAPLSFQWFFESAAILGATNASLVLTNVQKAQAGVYQVVVSNAVATVTSDKAVLTVSTAPACVPEPDGIVAWWPLDGAGDDIIGGSTMLFHGASSFAPGEVRQGVLLDGATGYGMAAASPALDVGSGSGLSIEAWINPADADKLSDLVEWNNGSGAIGAHVSLSVPNAYGGGPGSLYANLVDSWGVSHQVTTDPGVLASHTMQHVALTYDKASGLAALYVNGAQVALTNLGSFTPQTRYDLYLGMRPSGPISGTWFAGIIDELSLYNRSLTAEDIQGIYVAAVGGKCNVPRPPTILTPPQSVTAFEGSTAQFTVIVGGTGPFSYQWLFNGTSIPDATNPALTLTNVQPSQAGDYSVSVTNALGAVTSSSAALTVRPPLPQPPVIVVQPADVTTAAGSNVVLAVTAAGPGVLAYQWFWNGEALAAATNASLLLTNVQPSQAGTYLVVVANTNGFVASRGAVVNVNEYQGGAVNFANIFGPVRAPVYDVDGTTKLEGAAYLAQLYAGTNAETLAPVGAAVPFRTGSGAGLFTGGIRFIAAVPPGGMATVQVRAWESVAGPTFEQARAANGKAGVSDTFTVRTGGGIPPVPPAWLLGLSSFSLQPGGTPLVVVSTNVMEQSPAVLLEPKLVQSVSAAKAQGTSMGSFQFTVMGEIGRGYVVEVSTDLKQWDALTNVFNTVGPIHITDSEAAAVPHRFYRVRTL
ncbi:MAG: immunoglobulin domain-containing protein [Verrucomicrobia bacterium]|nr:immunoglobulin domain-containing protein [Verrucomicrobiota bacterium]